MLYLKILNVSETTRNCIIHWIEIYPVDSAIQLLNNWGQKYKTWVGFLGGALERKCSSQSPQKKKNLI